MPSYRRRHPFPRPPPSPPRRAPPARTLPRTFYRPSVRPIPPLAYMDRPAPAGIRACARGYTHIPAARLIPNYPLDLTPTAPPPPPARSPLRPFEPAFPPPLPAPELPAANFD